MYIYARIKHDFCSIHYYIGEKNKIIVKIFKITEKSRYVFLQKIV